MRWSTPSRAESGFYRSDDNGVSFYRQGVPLGENPPPPAGGGGRAGGAVVGRAGGGRRRLRGGGGTARRPRGATGGNAPARRRQVYRGEDPHYYYEIFVDPNRPDTIWSEVNMSLGARTAARRSARCDAVHTPAIHVDFHAIVFDPNDKNHLIFGNDGGLYETWDFGKSVRHFDSLPISQFYRIAVDNALPFYKVCGGLQDNNSMCGPSRTISIRDPDERLVSDRRR